MAIYILTVNPLWRPAESYLGPLPGAVEAVLTADPALRDDVASVLAEASAVAGSAAESAAVHEASALAGLVDLDATGFAGVPWDDDVFTRVVEAVVRSGDRRRLEDLLARGAATESQALTLCAALVVRYPEQAVEVATTIEALVGTGDPPAEHPVPSPPDVPEAELMLYHSSLLTALERPADAVTELTEALAAGADEATALAMRAEASEALERWDEVLADHRRLLALRPRDPKSVVGEILALHHLGRVDELLAATDVALAEGVPPTAVRQLRAVALQQAGRYPEAVDEHSAILSAEPDTAASYADRAGLYAALGRFEDALADYRAHRTVTEPTPLRAGQVASLLCFLDRYEEAVAELTAGRDTWPDDQSLVELQTMVLVLLGRRTEALALTGRGDWSHFWRGVAHHVDGDHTAAAREFERALALANSAGDDFENWPANRAHYLLATGDVAAAEAEYRGLLDPDTSPGTRAAALAELRHILDVAPDLPGFAAMRDLLDTAG